MRRNNDKAELDDFMRREVKPYVNRLFAQNVNGDVTFVDYWESYEHADDATIWDGSSLYFCHREKVQQGGLIYDEWVEDPMPLKTDTIYVDCEHDATYRWDGSEMVSIGGGGGGISVVETDQQTYDNMASHDANTLYVITSLTPAS